VRLILWLYILGLVIEGAGAHAAQYVNGIPNLFNDSPSMTQGQDTLGRACYSLQASSLDLDCNPAFMADEQKTQLRINILGNDRLLQLNHYREQLNNNDQLSVANELLQQSDPLIAKASISVWFQHDWWAVGYVPFRAGFAFTQSNPAYPEISTQMYKESELFANAGLYSSDDNNFRVGLSGRYVQRNYVYQNFAVFDALADPSLVEIKHESALYLEPGVVYAWKTNWDPMFSWTYTNFPVFQTGDRLPIQPLFDFGFSSSLGDFSHAFHSALHYTSRPDAVDFFSRLSWGATYNFDERAAANLLLGTSQFGLGANGRLDFVDLGVSYKAERLQVEPGRMVTVSTLTVETGLAF